MIHNLKVADRLRGELGSGTSGVLVVIVDPVDPDRIAAWSKPAEAEASARLRQSSC